MSTRWYPLYQRGNPQLRIFLPNFWMKLIRDEAEHKVPPNRVTFIVSPGMSRYDVRSYLEKIYKVSVLDVRTRLKMGQTREIGPRKWVVKDDDYKLAYVTLGNDQTFTFPDIYPAAKEEEKIEEEKKGTESLKTGLQRVTDANKTKPGLPGWFC